MWRIFSVRVGALFKMVIMNSKWRKIIGAIPFLVICIIQVFSWHELLNTEEVATWRHYVAWVLIVANAPLYFFRYRQAVGLTGVILVMATFKLLYFFTDIDIYRVSIMGIPVPDMELRSLGLLVFFFVIHYRFLMKWYVDKKMAEAKKNMNIKLPYESQIADSILGFDKELKEIKEIRVTKIFAYTENNRDQILSLVKAGKISKVREMTESDLESSEGTDLIVVEFSDVAGNKYVSLVYDSDELWQDPEARDVVPIHLWMREKD